MKSTYKEEGGIIDIEYSGKCGAISMSNPHYHNSYEIYFLEEGSRKYIFNDTFLNIEKYDVVLIKPREIHMTSGGEYKRYLLTFKEDYLKRFFTVNALELLLKCFQYKVLHLNREMYEATINILKQLEKNPENFVMFARLLECLNVSASTENISPVKAENDNKIIRYIEQNYKSIHSLDEISNHFYISKFHLSRSFKKSTGMTVISYVNSLKLQSACNLLAQTDKNIEEIAIESGFSSSMYFCKIFKSYMNISPSQYRKKYKQKLNL